MQVRLAESLPQNGEDLFTEGTLFGEAGKSREKATVHVFDGFEEGTFLVVQEIIHGVISLFEVEAFIFGTFSAPPFRFFTYLLQKQDQRSPKMTPKRVNRANL